MRSAVFQKFEQAVAQKQKWKSQKEVLESLPVRQHDSGESVETYPEFNQIQERTDPMAKSSMFLEFCVGHDRRR